MKRLLWIHRAIAKSWSLILCPILWTLYAISGVIKRDEDISVYGAPGDRFYDNAKYKYLYETIQKGSRQKGRCYWVTNDRGLLQQLNQHGLPAIRRSSLVGILTCLRAKYYYFSSYSSDINFWTSRGAVHINLWHGLPLKRIEYDINDGPLKSRYNPSTLREKLMSLLKLCTTPAPSVRPNYIYSPFPFFDRYFISAFRISRTQVLRQEYPRVRFLKDTCNEFNGAEVIGSGGSLVISAGSWSNVILYAPTFRDSNRRWLTDTLASSLSALQRALKQNNAILIIKPHPNEDVNDLDLPPNITLAPSDSDIYLLMKNGVDIVISDYSSIIFDAVASNISVCLFWPDYEEYKSRSRELYFNLEDLFGGKPLTTLEELEYCFDEEQLGEHRVNELLLALLEDEE